MRTETKAVFKAVSSDTVWQLTLNVSQMKLLGFSVSHPMVHTGLLVRDLNWLADMSVDQSTLDAAVLAMVNALGTGRPDRMLWKRVMSEAIFSTCPSEMVRRVAESPATYRRLSNYTRDFVIGALAAARTRSL